MKKFFWLTAIIISVITVITGCSGGGGNSGNDPGTISVTINPSVAYVYPNGTQQFTASVQGASDSRVTWEVVEGNAGGGITENGLYTGPFATGTYHVKATSLADPTKSATATVHVAVAISYGEIDGWIGSITIKINEEFTQSDGWGGVWDQKIDQEVSRKYVLDNKFPLYTWKRTSGSIVEISGTIHDSSMWSQGDYAMADWEGKINFVHDPDYCQDYLKINNVNKTYSLNFPKFLASPIPWSTYYSNGTVNQTEDRYEVHDFLINDYPLPATGATLEGSKTVKMFIYPLWGSDGESATAKEMNVELSWRFVPIN